MQTSGETVRLLMRLGYWSVWHGLYREAATLFSGAQAARPQSEIPVLGMAVLALALNKPEAAVELLRDQAKALNPASELVEAHLGCALRLAGEEAAGLALLQRLALQGTDANARLMATNLVALNADQLKPHLAKIL